MEKSITTFRNESISQSILKSLIRLSICTFIVCNISSFNVDWLGEQYYSIIDSFKMLITFLYSHSVGKNVVTIFIKCMLRYDFAIIMFVLATTSFLIGITESYIMMYRKYKSFEYKEAGKLALFVLSFIVLAFLYFTHLGIVLVIFSELILFLKIVTVFIVFVLVFMVYLKALGW